MIYSEEFIQGNHSVGKIIKPIGVCYHHIYLSRDDIINMFTHKEGILNDGREFKGVSAHVVIWRDGSRTIFGEDNQKLWHAGVSEFKGRKYCNNFLLGVEFEGNTNETPLTSHQISSNIDWLIPRIEKWNIQHNMLTDHRTIAPGRKVDLNPFELDKVLTSTKYLFL